MEPRSYSKRLSPAKISDEVLDAYYKDLSRVITLSAEDERSLFVQYISARNNALRLKLTDPQARGLFHQHQRRKSKALRERLVKSCLKLVFSLARRYWMDQDFATLKALISAGNVGLLEAVEKFDPERGTKFSSYASFWVLMYVRNELSSLKDVVAPPSKEKKLRMQSSATRNAAALGTPKQRSTNLYSSIDELSEVDLVKSDFLDPGCEGETSGTHDASDLFQRWFKFLTVREQFILRAYYGMMNGEDGLKLRQISNYLGLSSERVRQIKFDALSKMKRWMEHDGVTSYSDVF